MKSTLHTCLTIVPVLSFAFLLCCCKNNPTANTNDTFPDSNVTYGKYIQPIFDSYCMYSGCHNSLDQAGNPPLILDSYFDVTKSPGIVIPGKSGASLLYLCISGQGHGQVPMPPINSGYSALSSNKIKAIKTWIDEGAKPY